LKRCSRATSFGFRRAPSIGMAATATTAMTHIAIPEGLDGKNVSWLEKISEERYRG